MARARRPVRHPVVVVAVTLVAVFAAAELTVRWLEPQLPIVRAGDAAQMVLKAERIERIAASDPNVDVVFFGTSMMDSAVSPEAFLASSPSIDSTYNAGVVGAPTATQVRWAEEIVLANLDPDVIVLGIHPIDLLLTDVLNLNIQPQQADVVFGRVLRETKKGPIGDAERFLYDQVALVQQRGNLRRPQLVTEAAWNQVVGNEPKRFIPLRDEDDWRPLLSPLGESALFHGETFRITPVQEQLRANMRADAFSVADLHRLFEVTLGEGARVVVVIPPVPVQAWQEVGIDLSALSAGTALIRSIAADFDVPVLDFSFAGYPNEAFADLVHMNERGADRFSRELAQRIERELANG